MSGPFLLLCGFCKDYHYARIGKEKDNAELDNIVVRPEGEGSILRTEKLVKRYGKRTVANGVSINVKQGEIVGTARTKWCGKNHVVLYDDGIGGS